MYTVYLKKEARIFVDRKQIQVVPFFYETRCKLVLLDRPTGRSVDLKLYPWTFFLYQATALCSHAVDSHQMYSGGSVVRKASTVGIEISSTRPL